MNLIPIESESCINRNSHFKIKKNVSRAIDEFSHIKNDDKSNENQETEKKKLLNACKCKNSHCIKLYCECFRFEQFCKDCACLGGMNVEGNRTGETTVEIINKKRKGTFRQSKISKNCQKNNSNYKNTQKSQQNKTFPNVQISCNCRSSGCKIRHCVCFKNKLKCNLFCQCNECQNLSLAIKTEPLLNKTESIFQEKHREIVRLKVLEKLYLIKEINFGTKNHAN